MFYRPFLLLNMNRNHLGIAAAVGLTLVGLSQCPGEKKMSKPRELSSAKDDLTSSTRRTITRIWNPNEEEGPEVDLTPYLDEDGELKKDFKPSKAVADCITQNSDAFGHTSFNGVSLLFPGRIETEPEGAYPIKLIEDFNNGMFAHSGEPMRMEIVGAERTHFDFDLTDVEGTAAQVKTACERGIEQLAESHSSEDFCSDSFELPCKLAQQRWETYAEWGQTLRASDSDFIQAAQDLGFESLDENGKTVLTDGWDRFEISRKDQSSPLDDVPWQLGFEVVYKTPGTTNVVYLRSEDAALNFIADPDAMIEEERKKRMQGWSFEQ